MELEKINLTVSVSLTYSLFVVVGIVQGAVFTNQRHTRSILLQLYEVKKTILAKIYVSPACRSLTLKQQLLAEIS